MCVVARVLFCRLSGAHGELHTADGRRRRMGIRDRTLAVCRRGWPSAAGRDARVAELVDAPDLGSGSLGSEGSTPFARTIFNRSGFRHQNHCLNHTNSERNNNKYRWCLFWCLFFFRKVFFRQIVFPSSRFQQSTDSRALET